jgi:aspartate/methionine/tyrosine aminotransferase
MRAFTVNRNIVEMEYAVRGPIPQRAAELRAAGRQTIPCNIGNPQALGQKPISYYRRVLALLQRPDLVQRERVLRNVCDRGGLPDGLDLCSEHELAVAERMLAGFGTGVGAYTESKGPRFVREAVAAFIDRRDGTPEGSPLRSDPERVFLTNGASEAAKHVIEVLLGSPTAGIMIPIPQYPLYSATVRKCGGVQVDYFPDEERGWALSREMLEEPLAAARRRGIDVKAIVVINPGNPTGAVLDRSSVDEVIELALDNGLAIIADEVYQDNLYGAEFFSFAEVLGSRPVPLFSLHSVSKGFYGECGQRGGYLEVRNPPCVEVPGRQDLDFMDLLVKQASVSLCSNTMGHALTYLMVSPPPDGSEPYERFRQERATVLRDLFDKATMIRGAFEEMDGVECFGRTGAMYLFPRLGIMPPGATDFDYCMSLLEETGLCTVNGSGFGQRPGTHHLRIAFLPPREQLEEVLPRWIAFHNDYVRR